MKSITALTSLTLLAMVATATPTVTSAQTTTEKATMEKKAMEKDESMKKDAMMVSHYVIKSGDSLWNIAESTYGNGAMWTKIMAANKGLDADQLMVGKSIDLPK